MSIVLTRKELYDRVWSEPKQRLSKEFGLSDVGLAKTCRRYGIPVPSALGRRRPLLLSTDDPQRTRFRTSVHRPSSAR